MYVASLLYYYRSGMCDNYLAVRVYIHSYIQTNIATIWVVRVKIRMGIVFAIINLISLIHYNANSEGACHRAVGLRISLSLGSLIVITMICASPT